MFMDILRWIMTIIGSGMAAWFIYLWIDEIKLDAYMDGWFSCAENDMIARINEVCDEVKEEAGL